MMSARASRAMNSWRGVPSFLRELASWKLSPRVPLFRDGDGHGPLGGVAAWRPSLLCRFYGHGPEGATPRGGTGGALLATESALCPDAADSMDVGPTRGALRDAREGQRHAQAAESALSFAAVCRGAPTRSPPTSMTPGWAAHGRPRAEATRLSGQRVGRPSAEATRPSEGAFGDPRRGNPAVGGQVRRPARGNPAVGARCGWYVEAARGGAREAEAHDAALPMTPALPRTLRYP
jgi:hypothetical protein